MHYAAGRAQSAGLLPVTFLRIVNKKEKWGEGDVCAPVSCGCIQRSSLADGGASSSLVPLLGLTCRLSVTTSTIAHKNEGDDMDPSHDPCRDAWEELFQMI